MYQPFLHVLVAHVRSPCGLHGKETAGANTCRSVFLHFALTSNNQPVTCLRQVVSAQTAHLSPEAKASLPRHVAIIMDGNGRWARQSHLPRIEGHRAGAESARIVIRTAGELGIKYLTLYAFSVENWNRPKDEVDALMKYLVHYLKSETPELNKNNVRLEIIGQTYRLPEVVQEHLKKSIATLSKNNGLTLIMALSYGGRTEIVEAARSSIFTRAISPTRIC